MGVASIPQRSERGALAGDKAARIVEAMRASVATRGIAGSTFDHVALADGMAIRRLSEPELSLEPLLAQAIGAARALVA